MPEDDESQLHKKGTTKKLPDLLDYLTQKTVMRDIEDVKSALVAEERCITLFLMGLKETLCFGESPVITLGRFSELHPTDNLFDLTPYHASDRGVSRIHCQLTIKDHELYISDCGSTNGTYLNGSRLRPNQPYIVKKRNAIALGRLPIKILTQ